VDRRRQIRMSEAELVEFLDSQRMVTCATIGPGGRPHLAGLWYVPAGGRLDCWTYAASQKARNLERDPRATLMTETGGTYQELRGVSMECDAELVRDPGLVLDIGVAVAVRYGALPGPDLRAAIAPQAAKRVGIRFHPTRVSSWDHRKLGGGPVR
jgi:PPOX class probable F420-dependent enzyme